MRLLIDTHALLWWLTDDPALPASARKHLARAGNTVLVSSASAWEIATNSGLESCLMRAICWLTLRAILRGSALNRCLFPPTTRCALACCRGRTKTRLTEC